ncbi:MAG: hypothetical protein HC914_05485 [Chloroflexaceae bacterium]|nr:hypothetical protein [Chloroflexaceae bacterium]
MVDGFAVDAEQRPDMGARGGLAAGQQVERMDTLTGGRMASLLQDLLQRGSGLVDDRHRAGGHGSPSEDPNGHLGRGGYRSGAMLSISIGNSG